MKLKSLLLVGLLACISVSAQAFDLRGKWVGECEPLQRGWSAEAKRTVSSLISTTETSYYYNSFCSRTPEYTVERVESYVVGTLVPRPAGSKTLDLTLHAIRVTPRAYRAVNEFNRIGLCGIRHWNLGESEDVSGLNCQSVKHEKTDSMLYTIVRVDRHDVRFGKRDSFGSGRDGTGPTKRPTELSKHRYTRQ